MIVWKKPKKPALIKIRFYPLLDITAYELAFIMNKIYGSLLQPVQIDPKAWEGLEYNIKRHFKEE